MKGQKYGKAIRLTTVEFGHLWLGYNLVCREQMCFKVLVYLFKIRLNQKSERGRYMKGKRQSTVEQVFGTLTQFMGMRKVNTLGIKQASKVMLMATVAYNIRSI
jgi:hypothetical protein